MHPARLRTFLIPLLAPLLLLIAALGVVLSPSAGAAGAPHDGVATVATVATVAAAGAKCTFAPHEDDTIHIRGCLRDQRQTPPAPVPGVAVAVSDADGNEIESAETNEDGAFDITLPGASISNLGKEFVITLDQDTLPEGAALRNPKQVELRITFNTTGDQVITFPIGDALPEGPGEFNKAIGLLVDGLTFSVLLAMAALGLSMIFGTTGLTNFAHGELITFGALIAYAVDRLPGTITIPGFGNVTIIVGVLASLVAGAGFGLANDKLLWAPLRRRGTGVIAMMIVSIGLSIFLRNVYQYVAGGENHNFSQYSNVKPLYTNGTISITGKNIAVISISVVVLVVVALLLAYTRIGKATRAVADNPALAASSGINVERVIAVVWTAGAALAGLSGSLLGLTQGFDYQLGFKILLLVFAATVLGGLGTISGSILGAIVIGILVEVSTLVIPAELKYVGALAVLIIVLLIRPQGLLGRAQRVG